jgi:hypothetical protein
MFALVLQVKLSCTADLPRTAFAWRTRNFPTIRWVISPLIDFVGSGILQCCGSGMFILDSQHCWIPDLKQQQKRGVKRTLLSYLFL